MKKQITILSMSLCLIAIGALLNSCSDKALEINSEEGATTRAMEAISISKYYQVIPGTPEWYSLMTVEEMWQVSQIPIDIIKDLSTEELVVACQDFPLCGFFDYYDKERDFFDFAFEHFNGLQELIKRNDGISAFIDAYSRMEYQGKPIESRSYATSFSTSMAYMELIMANHSFLETMTKDEMCYLIDVVLEKLKMKLKYPDYFDLYDIKHSFLLYSELIIRCDMNLTKEELLFLEKYIDNYQFYDPISFEEITMKISEIGG